MSGIFIPNYPSQIIHPSPVLDHINPNHPSKNINPSPFKTIHSIPSQQSFHLHTYPSIQIHPSLSQTIKPQTIFPSPLSIPNNPSNSIPNDPSISIPNHLSISIPNHPFISYPNHPFISIPNHLSISIPNHPSISVPNHQSRSTHRNGWMDPSIHPKIWIPPSIHPLPHKYSPLGQGTKKTNIF